MTHGLYLLWWVQEKHVSAALVATWLAMGDFAVMALEVPTGWLADRVGDRRSLVAGSCVQVVGMLACWWFPGVSSLAAGGLLIALGDALRSGADQALLYRSCLAAGVPGEFQRIEGRTRSSALLALVLLTLAGGWIVGAWGWHAAWALDTALCALGVAIAMAMASPPATAASNAPPDRPKTLPRPPERPGRSLVSLPMLIAILPAAVVGAAASAMSFGAQVGAGASTDSVASIAAVFVLAEAAGLAAGGRVAPLRAPLQCALAALALLALAMSLSSSPAWGWGAGAILAVVLSFAAGALEPWRAVAIQRLATDGRRATAASLANASDMACSTLLLPIAGFMQRRRG